MVPRPCGIVPGQQIGRGIVVARLGKLPIRGTAGKMRNGQRCNEHNKSKNNDECGASGRAIAGLDELFHGGKTLVGLEETVSLRLPTTPTVPRCSFAVSWTRTAPGHKLLPVILRMADAKMLPGLVGLVII